MLPVSHVFSGFLVLLGVKTVVDIPVTGTVLAAAAVFAVLPDVDAFFASIKAHHQSPLHAPLCWIGLAIVLPLFPFSSIWTVLLPAQGLMHIFFDFATDRCGGIHLFYPFSRQEYSLPGGKPASFGDYTVLELDRETLHTHLTMYAADTGFVLFELAVSLAGVAAFFLLL